jgi:hypothetical protein
MKNIKNLKPNVNGPFVQGYYKVNNPEKYAGDPRIVIFRSSWERKFMILCDLTPQIIRWGSEPVQIKYISPLDQREHIYNVDFFIEVMDNENKKYKYIIEIKPSAQISREPVLEGRMTEKKLLRHAELTKMYTVNKAKQIAAMKWAMDRDMKYIILTEENWPFKG